MLRMNKIYLVLFSFVFLTNSFAQSNFWEKAKNTDGIAAYTFSESANGNILAGTGKGIYISTDQGQSWNLLSNSVSLPLSVAMDSQGGILAGNDTGIFRTLDNGQRWIKVLNTKEVDANSSVTHPVFGIVVLKNVVLAGTEGLGIYRSTDNGQHWAKVTEGLTNNDIYSMTSSPGGIVYAGTKDGVYRSTDSGISWEHKPPVRDFTYALAADSCKDVYAGVSYTNTESGVYKSTDAGDTWSKYGLQNVPVDGLALDSKGNLLATVYDDWNPANAGVYMASTNSNNWTHIIDGLSTLKCRPIIIASDGSAIVGTGDGGIYRSSHPLKNITSVNDNYNQPGSFALLQNYPNPFNPTTTISYELPFQTNVTLSVFNELGQKVALLVNGIQAAGNHNIIFNASNLSSGIYLYRIEAGNFHETKKLILLK